MEWSCRVKPGNDEERVTIMANNTKIRAAVLGASGYTGADLIRLAARHPNVAITALIAKGHAGQALAQVFPHLSGLDLPALVTSDEVDWDQVDVAFCGLPHATAHAEIAKLPRAHQGGRYVGRLQAPRSGALRRMVWRRPQRAGIAERCGIRADRALCRPRSNRRGS